VVDVDEKVRRQVDRAVGPLVVKVAELRAELAELRARLAVDDVDRFAEQYEITRRLEEDYAR
jgi:hypothetical protein